MDELFFILTMPPIIISSNSIITPKKKYYQSSTQRSIIRQLKADKILCKIFSDYQVPIPFTPIYYNHINLFTSSE